jgi:hypothetical protein
MKHLRKFNEAREPWIDVDELRDFCETNLAYLLDEGFEIDPNSHNNYIPPFYIKIYNVDERNERGHIRTYNTIEWDNIKDHFIPFISRLNTTYNIESNIFFVYQENGRADVRSDFKRIGLDDILNDVVPNQSFHTISIKLHNKK